MENSKQSEKQRSSLYPAATIEECLEILNIIKGMGGKNCSVQSIADKMGVSITTNSFKFKISSSKQYGLIDNIKGVIQLTERAKTLLYPTVGVSEKEILLACFQSAPLYAKIIQNFLGKALPSLEKLANELMIKPEYGITVTAKKVAAECFIKNAEYLGVLQNGILTFDVSHEEEVVAMEDVQSISPKEEPIESKTTTSREPEAPKSGYRFQIPMLSGKNAEIYLPENISETDLEFFEQSVNYMLPLFIKNLKTTLDK